MENEATSTTKAELDDTLLANESRMEVEHDQL